MSNFYLSQNILCRSRRDFLEHVGVTFTNHMAFEVEFVQMMVPIQSFRVRCTNKMGWTYFSGATWTRLVDHYGGMQPGERCTFFLDLGDV